MFSPPPYLSLFRYGIPKPHPQLVNDSAWGRSGVLPLLHQVAVTTRRRSPVRRFAQGLGLRAEPLLHHLRLLPALVEFGEVRFVATRVRGARRGEAVPQLVVGRTVEPRERLPAFEQLA